MKVVMFSSYWCDVILSCPLEYICMKVVDENMHRNCRNLLKTIVVRIYQRNINIFQRNKVGKPVLDISEYPGVLDIAK